MTKEHVITMQLMKWLFPGP